MLTESIFAPIWGWLFFNEIPPTSVFIGGLMIISAVVMKSLDKPNKNLINSLTFNYIKKKIINITGETT